jgi:hypothetical protein
MPSPWVVKRVLLSPAPLRRAAARRLEEHERWLLRQPGPVRRAFVREVIDRGWTEGREQAWMLMQPDGVRLSYVAEVLGEAV